MDKLNTAIEKAGELGHLQLENDGANLMNFIRIVIDYWTPVIVNTNEDAQEVSNKFHCLVPYYGYVYTDNVLSFQILEDAKVIGDVTGSSGIDCHWD